MIPVLFGKTETAFTSNGLGRLSDAISCIVTEERNGAYELAMEYPEKGIHEDEIETDKIIFAKPAVYSVEQPFRIYKITKPLNGRFKVLARHISYDLAYISVMPFGTVMTAYQAMNSLASHADNIGNFTIGSVNVSKSGSFGVATPASFRNLIGGKEGSILDVFGGELEWDRFRVNLYQSRGTNRGLTLRYGKNISDISEEKDIDYTVTGITPFYKTGKDVILTLPEKTVYKTGASYSTPRRVRVLDCGAYIDEEAVREANPDENEEQIQARLITAMRSVAQAYANENLSGVPDSSIEVSFVDLGATEEYKDKRAMFTQAGLCDTVTVYYERLGIETTAKIIKTEYNVLLDRFEKLTIGKAKATLADRISDINKETRSLITGAGATASAIREISSLEALQAYLQALLESEQYADTKDSQTLATAKGYSDTAIAANAEILRAYADACEAEAINRAASNTAQAVSNATNQITGVSGGYVRINRDANGHPFEILIMDNQDINRAVKIWRWNQNGLGYSRNGYNGNYETAITADGTIVGSFIAANTLNGIAIISGTLDAGKITTGKLDAALIKTGLLQDAQGKNLIDMVTGEFSLANGNLFFSTNQNYLQLTNNMSLRLNGIPLAGVIDKEVGRITDNERVSNIRIRAIVKPYDCTLIGNIFVKKDLTYSDNTYPIIEDIPVLYFEDDKFNYAYYDTAFSGISYGVTGQGVVDYRTDQENLIIKNMWQSFISDAAFEAWTNGRKYYRKVISRGTIYGVWTEILVASSIKKDDIIQFAVTYPIRQSDKAIS